MGRICNAVYILIATVGCVASHTALAIAPLGFYVGAGIGQANVQSNADTSGESRVGGRLQFDERHLGWKALVGIRPISLLGAEIDYFDFGRPQKSTYTPVLHLLATETEVRTQAIVVFALAYLPVPQPFDIYAKVGLARVQATVKYAENYYCTIDSPCPFVAAQPFRQDQTDTRFAYGLGAQVKYSPLAVRGEYERISSSTGYLLSLGLTWQF